MSLRDEDIEFFKKRFYDARKYCDTSTILALYERKCLIPK
jgi:hypothetical protein